MVGLGGAGRPLPHLVWDAGGKWAPGVVRDHERVNLTVEVCSVPYQDYRVPVPSSLCLMEATGLVDTGCM